MDSIRAENATTSPANSGAARKRSVAEGPDRRRIVSKLWRTAERQVREVEQRLAQLRDDPAAMEREAKTLAIIARTVRDLVAIDEGAKADHANRDADHGFQRMPIADFRRELAQKLEQLRDEGAGGAAP